MFLDPEDPDVRRRAEADGIPHDWIEAARRSPVYDLAVRWQVALPLHPEYRTLPMVWYVPPLSPVMSLIENGVDPDLEPGDVFGTIDELRIPVEYLASMLSAGDPEPVRLALRRLAAMRAYKRTETVDGDADAEIARAVGIDPEDMELMFRQVAIGDYDDRYVIPKAHPEAGDVDPNTLQGSCGLEWVDREIMGGPEQATDFDLRDHITRVDGEAR